MEHEISWKCEAHSNLKKITVRYKNIRCIFRTWCHYRAESWRDRLLSKQKEEQEIIFWILQCLFHFLEKPLKPMSCLFSF